MPIYKANSKGKLCIGASKVKAAYQGAVKVYSSGNTVTYRVDSGVTYTEEVDEGASCLSPKTFTPSKSGWNFVGWRQDTSASSNVLGSLVMGDNPITLYAVFKQTVTLSYNGNGNTGGSTDAQTGTRYYNNGNVANPSFTLRQNGFIRTDYNFSKWAMGSAGGTQYSAGASVTLSENTTFYAVWVADKTSYQKYNGNQITLSSTFGEIRTDVDGQPIKQVRQYDDTPSHVSGSMTITLPISLKNSDVVRFNFEINCHLITVGVVDGNIEIDGSIAYGIDTFSKISKSYSASSGQNAFTVSISGNAEERDDDDAEVIYTWSILSVEINP